MVPGQFQQQLSPLFDELGLGPPTSTKITCDGNDITTVRLHADGQTYDLRIYWTEAQPQSAKDEVVALMWLHGKCLTVTPIVAYDFAADNELAAPYVLERTVVGESADKVYGRLSMKERFQIVDAMAHLTTQMHGITFPQSGSLVAAKNPKRLVVDSNRARTKAPPLAKYLRIAEKQPPNFLERLPTTG